MTRSYHLDGAAVGCDHLTMRMALLLLAVVCSLGACGASSAQIHTARTAIYVTRPVTIFDIAMQVTQWTYPLRDVDPARYHLETQPQFYNSEGGRESPGADGFVNAKEGSVSLTLIIDVLLASPTTNNEVVVRIAPKTYEVMIGSPKPRELRPDDPNLPPWIHGRVDALAVEIYKYAKQYAQAR